MRTFIAIALAGVFVFSPVILQADEIRKPTVEVVFVLDTTGSMTSLIAAAKDKIWSIVGTLASARPVPRIKLGLVGYRDRGDEYVTRLTPLTEDIDAVYGDLMKFQADGGGDSPESVNQALSEAVRVISWSAEPDTMRVIFLVGDCPPHMNYPNDVKYPTSCREAKAKGIVINTIQMGNYDATGPIWREIARLTQGDYFSIAMADIHTDYKTPYDKDIAELADKHGATRVYYGDSEAQARAEKKMLNESAILESSPDSVKAQRSMFNLSEAGKANFAGGYELVDQVMNGEINLKDLKQSELPEEMRSMTPTQRERYIATKAEERKKLEKELQVLNTKRQEYIRDLARKNASKEEKSFENQVFKSLKSQGADKHIELNAEMTY